MSNKSTSVTQMFDIFREGKSTEIVEITVDFDKIARTLALKVLKNKNGKSTAINGAVVIKHIKK